MSWLDDLTEEQREFMRDVNGNLSHVRTRPAGTKVLQDGQWVEPAGRWIQKRSMFPYRSSAMAVDPSEVPEVVEQLRKEGLFIEFDDQGRPEITSAKQHAALAKAFGMKTGRDGYGHTDQYGGFQNSGRRRNDEVQSGRGKIRAAIRELQAMPEDMPADAVLDALGEYDIRPTLDNTD